MQIGKKKKEKGKWHTVLKQKRQGAGKRHVKRHTKKREMKNSTPDEAQKENKDVMPNVLQKHR